MLHFFVLAHATGINNILPHLVMTIYNKIISPHEKMLKHEGFQPSGNIDNKNSDLSVEIHMLWS